MTEDKKKISIWRRLCEKYRISVLDEHTLTEHWHVRLNGWGAIVVIAILFLLSLALFSLAILYTPIKNYLPGYTENIRQQLIIESARVDSLGTSLELQRQYLNIIKQVMAGEAQSDTVQPLDSMQIIMREQLLEAKSEATAEFMAQYEEKEKDNMHLFTGTNYMETPVTAFFRPVMGNVTQHFSSQQGQLSITISTTNEASVAAVLDGVVLFVNHDVNNRYSIIIQHANYTSIYRQLKLVNKRVGDRVKIGENIGIANTTVSFQLWEDGSAIDPEKFIAF